MSAETPSLPGMGADDAPAPPSDRPRPATVRELVRLGVPPEDVERFGRRQAFAVLSSLRRRAAKVAAAGRPAAPEPVPVGHKPYRGSGGSVPGPGRVDLLLLLDAGEAAALWDRLLADPGLADDRLAWAVSYGVMRLPPARLRELADECRAAARGELR